MLTKWETSKQTGRPVKEQKAAGIDAMVYIYRLKCPSSFPSCPPFLFLSRLSSRIRLPFQPNYLPFSPAWRWKKQEKRTVHPVWSHDRDIFPDSLPFRRSSIHSSGPGRNKKKKKRPSIRPHAAFRAIVSAKSRYTDATIVLLDIHSIWKEVREAVAKIALYATIRQTESFRSVVLFHFSKPSLEPSAVVRYDKTYDDFRLYLTISAKTLQNFLSYHV